MSKEGNMTEEPVMPGPGDTGHPYAEGLPLEEQVIDEKRTTQFVIGDNLATAMRGREGRRRGL